MCFWAPFSVPWASKTDPPGRSGPRNPIPWPRASWPPQCLEIGPPGTRIVIEATWCKHASSNLPPGHTFLHAPRNVSDGTMRGRSSVLCSTDSSTHYSGGPTQRPYPAKGMTNKCREYNDELLHPRSRHGGGLRRRRLDNVLWNVSDFPWKSYNIKQYHRIPYIIIQYDVVSYDIIK